MVFKSHLNIWKNQSSLYIYSNKQQIWKGLEWKIKIVQLLSRKNDAIAAFFLILASALSISAMSVSSISSEHFLRKSWEDIFAVTKHVLYYSKFFIYYLVQFQTHVISSHSQEVNLIGINFDVAEKLWL